MKNRIVNVVCSAVALTALSLGCMAASSGCTALHKEAVATGAIAAGLKSAEDVNHNNPYETASEKTAVANYIAQAASANKSFVTVLQGVVANGGTVTDPELVAATAKLTVQVNQLQQLGLLKIKDPQAQALFSTVISTVQLNLGILQSLSGYTPPAATATIRLPRSMAGMAFALVGGISLTPEEIEELIALALAAGSALVPKLIALKGLSDSQILTNAEADDDAAIAEAEQDGAAAPSGETPIPNTPAEPTEAVETAEEVAGEQKAAS